MPKKSLFEEFREIHETHLADMRRRHEEQKNEIERQHGENMKEMAKDHASEMQYLHQRSQQVESETESLKKLIVVEKEQHKQRLRQLQQEQEAEIERMNEEIRETHLRNERSSKEYYEEFRATQMRMINQQRAILTANHNEGIFQNTNKEIIALSSKWANVQENYLIALSMKETIVDERDPNKDLTELYEVIIETLNCMGSDKVELDNAITAIMPRMGRIQNVAKKEGWEETRRLLQKIKEPIYTVAYVRSDSNKRLIEERKWNNLEDEMNEKREQILKLNSLNMELKVTVMGILMADARNNAIRN